MAFTRNQVLGTFGFFEGLFPCIFTLIVFGFRIYVGSVGTVPEVLANFNENVFQVSSEPSGSGFLYVTLYLCYVLGKFVMGVLLYHYVILKRESRKPKYVIWIIANVVLSIIGFLLLFPLRSHHVYETGIAFMFSVLSSFVSLVTVIYITVGLCQRWRNAPVTCDCEHDLIFRTVCRDDS